MSLIVRKPNLWPNMSLTCGCLLFGSDWRSLILTQLYDEIGIGYRDYRRPDSRIYTPILRFLGEARAIVDVGAGTGSSEPIGRSVVAVEPSLAMIRDRQTESAPVVQGTAADLPFRDGVFDAGVAILTVHHWPDQARGLTELARVAVNRIVILTSDLAP